MVRKTALVTAMLGAFASQAIAMGLGEIQLHSALNQPLLAEIELLSPTAADLNDLRATLASREAYAKAGVERGFFHTKLRFEVIKRPNGTAAIKITSHDPVREPYLDFLLEATWGSGQALREYTVLVDPPVLMPAPAPEYEAPVTDYSAPESSAPVYSGGGGAASGLVDGEYHVSRNDTTWGVANAVRPDGSVSMEQVMISLLRANPDAFINQNINNLKAGQVLRVPSRDEMAAITHAEAVADVRAQKNQWQGGSAPAPTPAATAAPSETPAAPASDAAVQAPDADAQLKLVAPKVEEDTDAAKAATGDQSLDEIRKELTLASEAVEAQRLENSDLSSRVKELEDQITKLHGLIELKDNEMARLAGTAAPTADGAVAPGTEAAPGETAPTTDAELTAPTAPMAEEPVAETPAEDTSAAAPADEAATPETEPAVPAPEVVAAAPPTKSSTPMADEGLLASLLANPLIKWGAVGGAVVIGLLAWMSGRRRRMEDADFQESILAGRHPGDTKKAARPASPVAAASTVAAAAAAEAVAQPKAPKVKDAPQTDSSLFTDFAVSDMGNIQSDAEADPIAEADVYLAYGRYQQAEELIRIALTRAPQRNELRFKLLEVLFAAKNAHAFDTEAEALLATLGSQDDEMWLRTVDMGQELNPGNPLYRASGLATATAAAGLDEGLDFNLGGSVTAETDFSSPQDLSAQRNDNSLEFDLGEFDAFSPQAGDAAPSMPIEEDLNFDLSMGDDDGEGLLASADEVATKLDLARAYVEMGDPDGARSILQEVLDEGNVEQKSEAQTLLSQIT